MELAITCMETKTSLWSLINQLEVMLHLQIIQRFPSKRNVLFWFKWKMTVINLLVMFIISQTIKSSILSLNQLLEKDHEIEMKYCTLTLLDTHGTMIVRVTMTKNRIFLLNIEMDMLKCLKSYVKDETWFWHMRLMHINFGILKTMT